MDISNFRVENHTLDTVYCREEKNYLIYFQSGTRKFTTCVPNETSPANCCNVVNKTALGMQTPPVTEQSAPVARKTSFVERVGAVIRKSSASVMQVRVA